jgi:hypothetical protein
MCCFTGGRSRGRIVSPSHWSVRASGDEGIYANRVELQNVKLRFPLPDLTAEYRVERRWGHVKGAVVGRTIRIDDLSPQSQVPGERLTGWGLSLSSNVRATANDKVHLELVYGHGIENYVNGAPSDVAAQTRYDRPAAPLDARTLPVLGATAFLDHEWSARWSSSLGYSLVAITNSNDVRISPTGSMSTMCAYK